MVPELLNYKVSALNPILKVVVPGILFVGTYFFFVARRQYGGVIGKVVNRLVIAGLFGVFAMSVRFAGDYLVFWKWAESLGYAAMCLANIYAVWPLLTFVRE